MPTALPLLSLRGARLALAAHLALIVAISVVAYTGHLHLPASLPNIDLVGHALAYGLLGALAHGALDGRTVGRVPLGPAVVLVAAGIEELMQGLSRYRHVSWSDYAADVAGVVVAMAAVAWWRRAAAA